MKNFKNILVAEDDNDDYLFLIEALEKISPEFMVRRATNGLQVMGYLKSFEKPDIIFLDLNMPIRNGIATLQLVKAIPEFRNIPIIVYSTSHYIKAIDEAFKNEAHYYIVKPTRISTLVENLLTVFNRLINNIEPPGKTDFVIGLKKTEEDKAEIR